MSIEKLIELSRATLSDEERKERQRRMEERLKLLDDEMVERHRCGYCGVDTLNYSHAFSCPNRGAY